MRSTFLNRLTITLIAISLLGSCKEKEKGEDDTPREAYNEGVLLSNISENIILPAYTNAASKATSLKTAAKSFTDSPSASTLAEVRAKWSEALFAWQHIAHFQIGPANDITLKEHVNTYPANVVRIGDNINGGSYNLESIANFEAKGLQAVDYLLNGIGGNDNDIIAQYTTDANANNRKNYLNDLAGDIDTKINSVKSTWENSYKNTFNNATGVDIGSSISLIINELNEHYERRIRDGKVAIPSGARTFSKTPLPDMAEARYDNTISRDLLLESLEALEMFYKGKDGQGLDDYLNHVEATYNDQNLDATIQNQFTVINGKVEALAPSIADEATNNQDKLFSIFDDMQFLKSLLKVEMTNALEVEITYEDGDGD